ncbi:MAG: DMT family transporter [Clostridiales bacterium]|nr:DMT family transporter [Clostridiales bacterium]
MDKNNLKGIVCVLAGASLWGFSGTCGQYLFMNYGFKAEWLTSARMLTAGIILTLFTLITNRRKTFDIFKNKKDTVTLLFFAFVGLLLVQFSYLKAIAYSNSGTATVLQILFTIIVVVYVCIRTPRLSEGKEILAIILAVSGVFLLATHGKIGSMAISSQALFWGLVSAFAAFVYNAAPVGIINKYGSIKVTGLGMLMGGAVFLIATGSFRSFPVCDISSLLATLVLCVGGTAIAFTLYLKGTASIGPVKASQLSAVEPVVATIISALWLKTKFYLIDLVGFALIISIIFIVSKKEDKQDV